MSRRFAFSRRQALGGAAAATAAAACDPGQLAGKLKAGGPAGPGSIDHVVFVMLENRSFDHVFGARRLEEGFEEEDGITADMAIPGADGEPIAPFHVSEQCPRDPPHSWGSSHAQFNEGANDGFCREYASRGGGGQGEGILAYQRRADLPFSWALADAFTLCDRWFCSVMGPTWPNRLFAHAGTSHGNTSNQLPDDSTFFEDRTIWNALTEKGVDWRYYYTDLPFLALYKDHGAPENISTIEGFFADVLAGSLPSVVQVEPGFSFNDSHPPHHPGLAELFIASIYEAIAASGYWDKTLIIVTYDEHGGFWDHVPPPTTADDRADEGFDQLGFRVPTLLIGPWVRQGVDHTVYDHTSWLKYVCERFEIEPWNARIAAANSLSAALDTERMAAGDPLPAVELPPFDFDPETIPDECIYYAAPPAYLQVLAEHLRKTGLKIHFDDPRATRVPWIAEWKRQGLVG